MSCRRDHKPVSVSRGERPRAPTRTRQLAVDGDYGSTGAWKPTRRRPGSPFEDEAYDTPPRRLHG